MVGLLSSAVGYAVLNNGSKIPVGKLFRSKNHNFWKFKVLLFETNEKLDFQHVIWRRKKPLELSKKRWKSESDILTRKCRRKIKLKVLFFQNYKNRKRNFLKLENRKLELNTPFIIFSSRKRDRAGACGGSAQARGFVRHHKTTAGTPRPCRERWFNKLRLYATSSENPLSFVNALHFPRKKLNVRV